MSQLTIYLPKEIEKEVKAGARRAKTSVSAYIASLVKEGGTPKSRRPQRWPAEFLAVLGSCKDFPEIDDSDLSPLDEPASWP